MEFIVEFDYEAKEDDELTLSVGEIITNVQSVSDGWCKGTLRGKEGMFPDNFVKEHKKEKPPVPVVPVVKRPGAGTSDPGKSTAAGGGAVSELRSKLANSLINPSTAPPGKKATAATKKAKVTFEYEPKNPDELALEVGQIVEVLKQEDEGWWEGSLNGKIGMFPSNFVALIDSSEQPPDEEASEIRAPRRVQGVGFGDIFKSAGGPIALRSTGPPVARKDIAASPAETTDNNKAIAPGPQRLSVKNKIPTPANTAQSAHVTTTVAHPPLPVVEPKPQAAVVETKPSAIRAIVRYPYAASNEDELSLVEGDIITILDQKLPDAGWWKGEIRGVTGVFPDNFVELIPNVSTVEQKPQRPPVPAVAPNGGLNPSEEVLRPKKEGIKEPPARPPSFLEKKPIPVKATEKPTADVDDHQDKTSEHKEKAADVSRSGTLDRVVPAEKVLKPLTVDRPKVGPGRRPPTSRDTAQSVEEPDTPKEEKPFAGHMHAIKEEPNIKKEPVGHLSPTNDNKSRLQQPPNKSEPGAGVVTSADLASLQREISRLREEMEHTKRLHDKRLADLTTELDEEKKTRLNLQVEIDRLKKRLSD